MGSFLGTRPQWHFCRDPPQALRPPPVVFPQLAQDPLVDQTPQMCPLLTWCHLLGGACQSCFLSLFPFLPFLFPKAEHVDRWWDGEGEGRVGCLFPSLQRKGLFGVGTEDSAGLGEKLWGCALSRQGSGVRQDSAWGMLGSRVGIKPAAGTAPGDLPIGHMLLLDALETCTCPFF